MSTSPGPVIGAVAGALSTVAFMVVHELWILDIWEMAGPMVSAGAACGWALAWSYRATLGEDSSLRWLGYVGLSTGLLVALGAMSFVVLAPRYTLAEASAMGDEALAVLLPPAIPLMIMAGLLGTAVLWMVFGRKNRALVPILIGQVFLVFFVGHNLALLGLLDLSVGALLAYAEFAGLTVFLAVGFLVSAWAVQRVVGLGRGATRP